MKKYLLLVITALVILSCNTAKQSGKSLSPDEPFYKALREAEAAPGPQSLKKVELAYAEAKTKHLAGIDPLVDRDAATTIQKRISEFSALQQLYYALLNSSCCGTVPGLVNYQPELAKLKNEGAEFYYAEAMKVLADTSVTAIRKANEYLLQTITLVPDYKDAAQRRKKLYDENVFVIAFTDVEDSTFFIANGFKPMMFTYSNDLFLDRFKKEIEPDKSPIPFLELLSLEECRYRKINPDWLIAISLPELYAEEVSETKTQARSVPVEVGKDSTGRPIYRNQTEYIDVNYNTVKDAKVSMFLKVADIAKENIVLEKRYDVNYYEGQVVFREPRERFTDLTSESPKYRIVAQMLEELYRQYFKTMKTLLAIE